MTGAKKKGAAGAALARPGKAPAAKPTITGKGGLPAVEALPWCSSFSVAVSKEDLKASREPALASLQAWVCGLRELRELLLSGNELSALPAELQALPQLHMLP